MVMIAASPPNFSIEQAAFAGPTARWGDCSIHLSSLTICLVDPEIFVTRRAEGIEDRICFVAHWLTLAQCDPAAAGPLYPRFLVKSHSEK
jgi:hypothetical protein